MAQASDDEGIRYDGRRVVDLSPAGEDWEEDAPGPRRSGAGKAVLLLLAAVVLVGAGMGAGWLIYSNQAGIGGGGAPLVRAPAEPAKVRPENPGGMEVPDTDKGIYDVVSGNAGEPRTEKLLDAPERPQLPQTPEAGNQNGQPLDITRPQAAPPAEPVAAPPPSAVAAPAPASDGAEAPAPDPSPVTKVSPAPAPAAAESAPKPTPEPEKKPIQLTKAPPASAAPEKPAPAKAAPSSGSWRIQVGALRDEAAARTEFTRLQRRHPDLLGSLGLSIMKVDIAGKGSFYRMRAGPLADGDAASALCGQLKAAKVPCLTVRPGS
ncbi:MAG: SPOR domain-containing protein [Rhodospirillales bacterium]